MKKSKIISLVLLPLLVLALILPLSVAAQGGGQEELILEVLKASGEDLGLSGVVAPGYKFGDAPSYLWSGMRNEYNVVMTVIPFTKEQDAIALLQDSLSQPTYHSAEFHGYPVAISEIAQSYQWRCGLFFFSVTERPESMEDTANVLYANAVKYGLISGQGQAAPESGEDQGKAAPETGEDQDESVYSEDAFEKLEEFSEKFKEVWNSFIDWIKSILQAK